MKLMVLLFILIAPALTQAFQIQINPGSYEGSYGVMGVTHAMSGAQSVELQAGSYHIIVGAISSFQINVSAEGSVEAVNGISAMAIGSELTFLTEEVAIDVAAYEGSWSLPSVLGMQQGSLESLSLVIGLRYLMQIAAVDSLIFELTDTGLRAYNKMNASTVLNNKITLNTVEIKVNPKEYAGSWRMPEIQDTTYGQKEGIALVPELNYLVQVGAVGSFRVNVTGSGDLNSQSLESAVVDSKELIFNTYSVSFDSGSYSDSWLLQSVTDINSQNSTVFLVPGVSFRLDLENGQSQSFTVNSQCLESEQLIPMGANSFSYKCSDKVEVPFVCEKKVYEVKEVKCNGTYIARNMDELSRYIDNEGLFDGKYKNLKIYFSPTEGIEVHSPCKINLMAKTEIKVNNVCLDGRKGVFVNAKTAIIAENMHLISEKGMVKLNKKTNLTVENLTVDAGKTCHK